jgi:hypothetical protein
MWPPRTSVLDLSIESAVGNSPWAAFSVWRSSPWSPPAVSAFSREQRTSLWSWRDSRCSSLSLPSGSAARDGCCRVRCFPPPCGVKARQPEQLARREMDAKAPVQRRRRAISAVVKEVAEHLGNTAAVCRSSYIDPRVIESFESGDTIAPALKKIPETLDRYEVQSAVESVVVSLLSDFEMAVAS